MAGRGNARGRGRRGGRFNQTPRAENIKDRLGVMPTYQRNNDRIPKKDKYKFVRQSVTLTSVASIPPDTKVKSLCKEFLKSYFEIFDQPGRPNLHSKYNEDAFFTFSTTNEMPPPIGFGRNLLKLSPEDSLRLLTKGKQIADLFRGFALTKHMVNNFTYDIPFYLANPMYITSMHIIVTGVFEDLTKQTEPLNAFTRVFVVKQVSVDAQGDPKYEIFNDLFMLQSPTPEQIKKYHSDAQSQKNKLAVSQDRLNSSTLSNQSLGNLTPRQEELLVKVMNRTGLTRQGASQLLTENNWIEETSMEVFQELSRNNSIPDNLFAKNSR